VSLVDQIKIICAFLDIPVHEGKITESLHLLFTLYLEFKNNPVLFFSLKIDLVS